MALGIEKELVKNESSTQIDFEGVSNPTFCRLQNEKDIVLAEAAECVIGGNPEMAEVPSHIDLSYYSSSGVQKGPRITVQDESLPIETVGKGEWPYEVSEKVEKKTLGKRYWGLGLGVLSSIIFSFATLAVKLLSHYDPVLVCLWRFYGIFLASLFVILYAELFQNYRLIKDLFCPIKDPEKLKCLGVLFLRGTAATGSYILFNISLQYLTLSDATVIAFSTPVFVSFLARIFLKEHCGLLNVLAVILTLIGVGAITKPTFLLGEAEMDSDMLIGTGLAMGSMSLLSIMYLCLRIKSVKKLNFSVVTLLLGFVGSWQCAAITVWGGTFTQWPITLNDWLIALFMSFSTFAGQVTATLACKYEEAGIVALLRTLGVVWAFILQFVFFSVIPNNFSLIGSLIILSGISFVVLQKYIRNNLHAKSPLINKLASIL